MIAAHQFETEDIPISLVELVHCYNTSCPSMCNYPRKRSFTYILSSAMLLEVLLKRILFSLNGRYARIHKLQRLVNSLGSRVKLRSFSKEELKYLQIDHSMVRYDYESLENYEIGEHVVDDLFEYFLDLALQVGVKDGQKAVKPMICIFDKPQLKEGTYRAFICEPGLVMVVVLAENIDSIYKDSAQSFAIKAYNELFEYDLSYDTLGGMRSVERFLDEGCEEVIV